VTMAKVTTFLLLICLLAPAFAGAQPGKPAPAAGRVTLDFKDIELADLIQTISELTGRNFIYDDAVKGKVTIISPESMSLDQAYQLFLTVLNVKGFTVVPAGKVNRIVPLREAKESTLPTVTDPGRRSGEQFITRLVPLQHLDATLMASTVLAPLIPKTSNIVAYPPTNTLIISDTAANIERLLTIIRQLDVPSSLDSLEVLPLQYADAQEVAQIITQVLTQSTAGAPAARRRAAAAQAGGQEASRILPYPRTNSLVVMANVDDLAVIKGLVARLDQRTTQTHAGIYVYYLENADAENLAKTLNEIVTGIRGRARAGTPQAAAAARAGQQPGQAAAAGALEAVAISPDKPTNSLIINSTPDDYEVLQGIIRQLDTKRKQVFVEALVLELSMDATRRLGASLQGAFGIGSDSGVIGTTNMTGSGPGSAAPFLNPPASLLTTAVNGIMLGGLFNFIEVPGPDGSPVQVPALSALIEAAKTDSDVNILSAPRLLTSDNEEAEIIVGQNVPIITQRLTGAVGGTDNLAQSVAIERRDVALTLRFTPQITEGDLVRLNIFQEITDLAAVSVGDVNQVGPTLTKRLLRNTVLAENGRTVVLGGLIGSNRQQTISKVPLLGDIPGLGWLFKRKVNTERKTNLLIFITPRIIRDGNDLAEATRRSEEAMRGFQEGIVPTLELEPVLLPETPAQERQPSRQQRQSFPQQPEHFPPLELELSPLPPGMFEAPLDEGVEQPAGEPPLPEQGLEEEPLAPEQIEEEPVQPQPLPVE
jgi:general secretion pathway protein D